MDKWAASSKGRLSRAHPQTRCRALSGEWEEKHMVGPPSPDVGDGLTHLYTAIVGTDNSVKLLVDNKEVKTASLLSKSDFKPPINPEKVIDDPSDKKPEDWIDDPKMDDPAATKPDVRRSARRAAHARTPPPRAAPCMPRVAGRVRA